MLASKALAAAVSQEPVYIEDVFSTYLYTGNGSTQTITNGIDLSGEGGLVWIKDRVSAYATNAIDTSRGSSKILFTALTDAEMTDANRITSFSATGFALGSNLGVNKSGDIYASWTFRKAEKFFDVVTYTGNGVAGGRAIAHSLGSTPGCVIVKRTDSTGSWWVWHRSAGDNNDLRLNATDAALSGNADYVRTATSTTFTVGNSTDVNANSGTYIAYLFAHDAGGFGLDGTDNVISCGSFTTDGSSNATVDLGWEPQWLIYKRSDGVSNWAMADTMRGWSETSINRLYADSSNAESTYTSVPGQSPTATGFKFSGGPISGSATYIYIAIRRGPMKTPEAGTEVFSPNAFTSSGTSGASFSVGFPSDLFIFKNRGESTDPFNFRFIDRLRGNNPYLISSSTGAEVSWVNTNSLFTSRQNDIVVNTNSSIINGGGQSYIYWFFRRAPGFFDVVCYTGTGVARTVNHNLAAVPELMIVKRRDSSGNWAVYVASLGATKNLYLQNTFSAQTIAGMWNNTSPTSLVFTVGNESSVNGSGGAFVAYLFATVAGVSKVGSYTGSGTTKQIDCGFTAGARLVLIKRTDSSGDWYVWDSARGIVAGNDPYLLLNDTAAEVTSTDYVDTYSAGFEISSTAPAAINANGGTFIFLAIS